jgi:hypothetical protein
VVGEAAAANTRSCWVNIVRRQMSLSEIDIRMLNPSLARRVYTLSCRCVNARCDVNLK